MELQQERILYQDGSIIIYKHDTDPVTTGSKYRYNVYDLSKPNTSKAYKYIQDELDYYVIDWEDGRFTKKKKEYLISRINLYKNKHLKTTALNIIALKHMFRDDEITEKANEMLELLKRKKG